jgi:dTDP-glucose 4,6-dehydratase
MTTMLITGGAGFIGSAFVHYIYDKYPDYNIIVLDALTYAGSVENLPFPIWKQISDRFTFWYGNVTNADLVNTLVAQSDIVVHFAAESHVTRSIYDNTQFFTTDVIGTQTVANAVCKHKGTMRRFVHISTSEVYGTALAQSMDESHPINPMSPYAAAKAGADRLVYSYWATYGIPAVILRPFNNYGPRQHLEKVLPRFITNALSGEPLRIHGTGESARDFIHVFDTCRAVDLLLHAPAEKVTGEAFNVGSGVHRSIASLADDVLRLTDKTDSGFKHIGDRPGQVMRHTADYGKIHRLLGWTPQISWEDGLRQTIDWYAANKAWWDKMFWMREIPVVTAEGKRELH